MILAAITFPTLALLAVIGIAASVPRRDLPTILLPATRIVCAATIGTAAGLALHEWGWL